MDIKLKDAIPSHYLNPNLNPTPAPSTLKQIAYSKDKKITYELEGIYEKKCKNRLRLAIKIFALTFFSFGFALISEKMRENWQSVWTGQKKIIVYLRKKEIIEAKPDALPQEIEMPKPMEKTVQVSSILKDDRKPVPKDPIKEKYDEIIKQHENKSYSDWFQSIKKEIEKDSKLSLKDFFLHLCKNDEAQKLINNKTLEDLTKCRTIVFGKDGEEKEIECSGLDCELLKLNTNFFESMWKESGFREADINTSTQLPEVDFETFQNLLKIIRDVSFLNKLDINQKIDLCNLSEFFDFKEGNRIKNLLRFNVVFSLIDSTTNFTKDLDLESFKHIYFLVNRDHKSINLRDKFVQRLIDSLKDQEPNERTLSIKKLRKDFDPMLILHIYASWRSQIGFSPFESEDIEKNLDLTFFIELYKSALVMQWDDLQRHFLTVIAAFLGDCTDDEYKKTIDSLEPSIFVGLFEIDQLKIEHLTEQKLASLRENYSQRQSGKSEDQIKINIIRHLSECFPRYQAKDIDSQFEKLSTLMENIQQAFPEIVLETLDSLQHRIHPYLPTILYIQKALEVLHSANNDKQKSFNEFILSIKSLSALHSSQADRIFFITNLANLSKTETLHILLKIRGNFETTQFITQILESNDKDKIQIVFREYFAQAEELYGSALVLSRSDRYMKGFKFENGFVYTSPHFLKILPLINSSEKLEWILEIIPQNELKEIFVECLRKGVIIEKNYTSKTYRIGLSTKETEETFIRLGY